MQIRITFAYIQNQCYNEHIMLRKPTMKNLETIIDLPIFEELNAVDSALLSNPQDKYVLSIINGNYPETKYYHDLLSDSIELLEHFIEKTFPISSQVVNRVNNSLILATLLLIKSKKDGFIEKPRFNEINYELNRIIEIVSVELSKKNVIEYDNDNPNSECRNDDLEVISVWVYNGRDVKSSHKKLLKSTNELKSKTINMIEELLIINDILEELKSLVVPKKNSQTIKSIINKAKSNKPHDYKTCAYCFRNVRLKNNANDTIAYHGFKRFKHGGHDVITGSCRGADFKPFEISADGTIAHINDLEQYDLSLKEGIKKNTELLATLTDKDEVKKLENLINSQTNILTKFNPSVRKMLIEKLNSKYPELAKQYTI